MQNDHAPKANEGDRIVMTCKTRYSWLGKTGTILSVGIFDYTEGDYVYNIKFDNGKEICFYGHRFDVIQSPFKDIVPDIPISQLLEE